MLAVLKNIFILLEILHNYLIKELNFSKKFPSFSCLYTIYPRFGWFEEKLLLCKNDIAAYEKSYAGHKPVIVSGLT
jgi:hypothetical protein